MRALHNEAKSSKDTAQIDTAYGTRVPVKEPSAAC